MKKTTAMVLAGWLAMAGTVHAAPADRVRQQEVPPGLQQGLQPTDASFVQRALPQAEPPAWNEGSAQSAAATSFESAWQHSPQGGEPSAHPEPALPPTTPVPEPRTYVLLALGLSIIGYVLRRRRPGA